MRPAAPNPYREASPAPRIDPTRLAAARLRSVDSQPWLAQALYAMVPVSDPGSGTFAVDDRWRLHVDPAALDRWTVDECAAVLLHEVAHLVRDHAGRARSLGVVAATAERWNLATDAEINDDLLADGVVLPGVPVTPRRLGAPAGRAAEFYFLEVDRPPVDASDDPVAIDDCGAGCHGVTSGDDEAGGDDERDDTSGDDGPAARGISEPEALVIRHRVARAVVESGSAAGPAGAGWRRWAEALLAPQVDWRRLLDGAVRSAAAATDGRADYSYRRPSRRRSPRVVLPSMHRPLPRVAVVVDTSGSVSDLQLRAAWSEVAGCLRSIGVRRDLLRVYAADVDVHRLGSHPRGAVSLVGGGGTDMRRAVRVALDDAPHPDVVVVITDGHTSWPAQRPPARLVVALLESPVTPSPPPVWATVVRIPEISPPAKPQS